MRAQALAVLLALTALLALGLFPGCTTESYCFQDCEGQGRAGASNERDARPDIGIIEGGGGTINVVDSSFRDGCTETNAGVEICDGKDNDCNGQIDDGIDYTRVRSCGTCSTDCTAPPNVVNPKCTPPSVLDGTVPGTCSFDKCAPGFYDLDPNIPGCEYDCPHNPNGTNTTDPGGLDSAGVDHCGIDDDCDGLLDEDVNLCDVNHCGQCGNKCLISNGTARCAPPPSGQACSAAKCAINTCNPGFYDIDGSPDNGCEYVCTPTAPAGEVCDGKDNDCDGAIDNVDPDIETQDPNVGDTCFGGTLGECASTAHAGINKCQGGIIKCCAVDSNNVNGTNPDLPVTGLRNGVCQSLNGPQVIQPGDLNEICNTKDEDCDGQIDEQPTDEGGVCGTSVGNCTTGNYKCETGSLVCRGNTLAVPETCNGQDDDCDGVIDGTGAALACTSDAACTGGQLCLARASAADKVCASPPSDVSIDCDVPTPAPAGATSPCRKGTLRCVGGVKSCIDSIRPTATVDTCGVDANCDGVLTNQPVFSTDIRNCGSCGNDCNALSGHATFTCNAGTCTPSGCEPGYINCDSDPMTCERPCTFNSNSEQCDGLDNNCNCQIDEGVTAPNPTQVCGVSPGASDTNCTTGVGVSCQAGSWRCTFPAGYCTGTAPDYCSSQPDVCDAKDNNCNGQYDENFRPPVSTQRYLDQPCFSDDGLPLKHGLCQGVGKYVCDGPAATRCDAVKNTAFVAAEACDTKDNDCDGLIDEPFTNKGSEPLYFVKPAVTSIGSAMWVFQYEASRAAATSGMPGFGNGYQTSAPAGTPLEMTQACSKTNVVPWFNLTPTEAEQTCTARGGFLCSTTDWTTACRATNSCFYGYSPRTTSCTQPYSVAGNRVCNIGLYDFDKDTTNGIQNALLPTASGDLRNCWADWSGTTGNQGLNAAFDNIRDIEGNLRELTKNGNVYSLMGGAFSSQAEDGATCDFDFYTVDASFKLFDTGFRCCFSQDPRL